MTQAERDQYRDRLTQLARRLRGTFSGLAQETLRPAGGEAAGGLSDAPVHLGDMAADAFAQDTNLGIIEVEGRTLAEVSAALERIDAGTFGTCQRCGADIGKARLDTLPHTPYCVDCARKVEDPGPLVERPGSL